ncbi:ATP-binding cassette domain-containing protein [Actinoplanes sp. NPDC049681]|uniref:ABC transporter ATP-binding protein n=1 Tax=Actinoplanes sp. NPDC049681 TaxID=3363905 RepID=UPI0037A7FB37
MSVLSAQAAGVRRRRRWLFRDLDVAASPGDVVAIVGPPGSGRTTVLLALARRFKLSAGRVDLTGTAALGYVPGVSEPESVLTVAEHVRERSLLAGRPAGEVAWHGLDPRARGWQLSPYEKQVLGLILARIAAPQVVALDGVDEGLDAAEREALWRQIRDVAAQGVAVLVTAREVDEAQVSTVVRLGGAELAVRADAVPVPGPDAGGLKTQELKAGEPGTKEPLAEESTVDEPTDERAEVEQLHEPTAAQRKAAAPVKPRTEQPSADRSKTGVAEAAGRETQVALAARSEADDSKTAGPEAEDGRTATREADGPRTAEPGAAESDPGTKVDSPVVNANGKKAGTQGQHETHVGEQK